MEKLINIFYAPFFCVFLLTSCSESPGVGFALSDAEKINLFKKSINEIYSENNLISSFKLIGNLYEIAFENGQTLTVESNIVDLTNNGWNTDFKFPDNSSISIGTVGSLIDITYTEDETSRVPLSKEFQVIIPYKGILTWVTHGKHGVSSDIVSKRIDLDSGPKKFFVHGLYTEGNTLVTIHYKNTKNINRFSKTFNLLPSKSIKSINPIEIDLTLLRNPQTQRFFLLSHRSTSSPMMIDQYGDIRYYLEHDVSYGLKQTERGTLLWAHGNEIIECTLSGEYIWKEKIPDKYGAIHHDIVDFANNKFLLTVNNSDLSTVEDWVILYDANKKQVENEWDLNLSIPKTSYFIGSDGLQNTFNDWFHNNSVEYVERDNTILLSGHRAGIVKLTWNNELVWILTDHHRYLTEPTEFKSKILSNQSGRIITWGQHNISYDELNDVYYLFDNGLGRNYSNIELFSQGVKFKVDELNLTFQVLKTFGEEFPDYYSPIISGIDYDVNGSTLTLFGSIGYSLNYLNNKDWIGNIWKTPTPTHGAVLLEHDNNGTLQLEIKVSNVVNNEELPNHGKDPGIYRASYSTLIN